MAKHAKERSDEQQNMELQYLLQENNKLKTTVEQLSQRLKKVEENAIAELSRKNENSGPDLEGLATIKANTESIGDLDLKFQLHENSVNDGHLIRKINNFQQRTTDAI